MFDFFTNLLSTVASFLFPLYASYKALRTSDPATLTPWLMYWVVFGCLMLFESWTYWILSWIPLYGYFRLLFLLYLMLPQTQGARYIYETYISPYLEENENRIEEFIVHAHKTAMNIGLEYLKKVIEYARVNFLGLALADPKPTPPPARTATDAKAYTSSLLSRFTIPSAALKPRGNQTADKNTGLPSSDFYNLLASVVSAVSHDSATPNTTGFTSESTTTIIPPTIRDTQERLSFIAAQRERLNIVLGALDQEATQLQRQAPRDGTHTPISDYYEKSDRPSSGLSKSRSDTDFIQIDAESGDEGGLKKRKSSGWGVPWGWGVSEQSGEKNSESDK